MIRIIRTLIPLLVFAIIAFFLWRGLHEDPRLIPSPLIGKPLPAFQAESLQDPNEILTQQTIIGKVALLNVWASWCISCQVEHPALMAIAKTNQVAIYGLNYKDQRDNAEKWLTQGGNPYQKVIFDPNGIIGINLGVYGTPETFLIDKQGIIRYKYIGPLTQQAWQNELLPRIEQLNQ